MKCGRLQLYFTLAPQDGTPVLHVAIEKRMEGVALKLIAAGCDVSLVDKVDITSKLFLDDDF